MTERVALPDATALDELRRRLGPTRRPIGMRRIRLGADVLDRLPDDVDEVRRPGDVLVVMDRTPMRRRGDDLKATVVAALERRFATRTAVLGTAGHELHADEAASAVLDARIADGSPVGCIVAVGSGTITDLAKDASMRAGDLPFVVVQTAASVNAFTDDMAVLLRDGVKRTVPSRWPDVVIADTDVLASTPRPMHLAGLGELCSMFTAPGDWYLARATGMDDTFDPEVVALFRDGADEVLESASRMRSIEGDPDMLDELAGRMALTGIAMGVAGRTAPLSGTEHLVSHLLDMRAAAAGHETGLHGAQVGVASVLAATIWHDTLDAFDPSSLMAAWGRLADDPAAIEQRVRAAFDPLDPSGRMADECWRDVRRKTERWATKRAEVVAFVEDWDAHRATLRELVAPPARLRAALTDAGAAATVTALQPPATEAVVRWALTALPLMRDRFTIADLRFLAGDWTTATIDRLLDASGILEASA
jgi:glycerol-1-phosphate dehydrogenase [NAD(P)+]